MAAGAGGGAVIVGSLWGDAAAFQHAYDMGGVGSSCRALVLLGNYFPPLRLCSLSALSLFVVLLKLIVSLSGRVRIVMLRGETEKMADGLRALCRELDRGCDPSGTGEVGIGLFSAGRAMIFQVREGWWSTTRTRDH